MFFRRASKNYLIELTRNHNSTSRTHHVLTTPCFSPQAHSSHRQRKHSNPSRDVGSKLCPMDTFIDKITLNFGQSLLGVIPPNPPLAAKKIKLPKDASDS